VNERSIVNAFPADFTRPALFTRHDAAAPAIDEMVRASVLRGRRATRIEEVSSRDGSSAITVTDGGAAGGNETLIEDETEAIVARRLRVGRVPEPNEGDREMGEGMKEWNCDAKESSCRGMAASAQKGGSEMVVSESYHLPASCSFGSQTSLSHFSCSSTSISLSRSQL
jgi:hypothetical protein